MRSTIKKGPRTPGLKRIKAAARLDRGVTLSDLVQHGLIRLSSTGPTASLPAVAQIFEAMQAASIPVGNEMLRAAGFRQGRAADMTNRSTPLIRASALDFASSFCNAGTTACLLEHAQRVQVFLEECPHEIDLRLKALTAARLISARSEEGMPDGELITDARAILVFLRGTTSSEHPSPCAIAESRSGAA